MNSTLRHREGLERIPESSPAELERLHQEHCLPDLRSIQEAPRRIFTRLEAICGVQRAHLVGYCLAVSHASKATGLGEILLGYQFSHPKNKKPELTGSASKVLPGHFLLLCYYSLYLDVFHCHLC